VRRQAVDCLRVPRHDERAILEGNGSERRGNNLKGLKDFYLERLGSEKFKGFLSEQLERLKEFLSKHLDRFKGFLPAGCQA